jgi:hypothetical protein
LFLHKVEGKCVIITLPDKYIVGPVIPGYHWIKYRFSTN